MKEYKVLEITKGSLGEDGRPHDLTWADTIFDNLKKAEGRRDENNKYYARVGRTWGIYSRDVTEWEPV